MGVSASGAQEGEVTPTVVVVGTREEAAAEEEAAKLHFLLKSRYFLGCFQLQLFF